MRANRHQIKKIICVGFAIAAAYSLSFAQVSLEEKIFEEQAESSEQSELVETLLSLKENPINLNTADLRTLEKIPGLTLKQRIEIINHRLKYGPFKTVDELFELPGIDLETYSSIRELVTVEKSKYRIGKVTRINLGSRISDRLDRPIGFKNGTYKGSPQKVYNRLRLEFPGSIRGGLLLEKDSGESSLDDLRRFYLTAMPGKGIQILIGHFLLEVGQGLVLWGPYGLAKSAEAILPIKKKERGIRGYSSVNETAGFFGAAASFRIAAVEITSLASKNKKYVATESVLGGRIRYNSKGGLSVGATFYHSSFDRMIQITNLVRNRFNFRGKENIVAGFDWRWTLQNVDLFGEAAQSKSGGRALLAGSIFDFTPVKLAILYRNYQKDFQNFHAFGFGERNGTTQNEKGYYIGLNYNLRPNTKINAYYDIFSNPWRTFFEPMPVDGREFLGQIEQKVGTGIYLTFRVRDERKQRADDFLDEFGRAKKELVEQTRTQIRLQLDYNFSKHLRLRNRIEFVKARQDRFNPRQAAKDEDGFLVYQDIRFSSSEKFQIQARLTFFESDSFDSRLFQYENDLPGVLTNRALFGRGNRWYFLVKYHPIKQFAAYLKYSETYRDDVDVIGSGPDQINGNLDRRVSMQLDIKLR